MLACRERRNDVYGSANIPLDLDLDLDHEHDHEHELNHYYHVGQHDYDNNPPAHDNHNDSPGTA